MHAAISKRLAAAHELLASENRAAHERQLRSLGGQVPTPRDVVSAVDARHRGVEARVEGMAVRGKDMHREDVVEGAVAARLSQMLSARVARRLQRRALEAWRGALRARLDVASSNLR